MFHVWTTFKICPFTVPFIAQKSNFLLFCSKEERNRFEHEIMNNVFTINIVLAAFI